MATFIAVDVCGDERIAVSFNDDRLALREVLQICYKPTIVVLDDSFEKRLYEHLKQKFEKIIIY